MSAGIRVWRPVIARYRRLGFSQAPFGAVRCSFGALSCAPSIFSHGTGGFDPCLFPACCDERHPKWQFLFCKLDFLFLDIARGDATGCNFLYIIEYIHIYFIMLYYIIWYCIILSYITLYFLYYLYYIILYYTILYCTILCYIILYHIYFVILSYYVIWYCIKVN